MMRTKTKAAPAPPARTAQLEAALATAREQAVEQALAAKQWAAPRYEVARIWVEPKARSAGGWAEPKVRYATEWVEPRLKQARDAGVQLATPHVEAAAGKLAPAVDSTREKLVEDVLPKIAEGAAAATAAAAAAKVAASERGAGAYSVLKGDAVAVEPAAKKRRSVGKLFLLLGILAAAGAALFSVLRRKDDSSDPWAQPYPTYPPTPVAPTSTPGTPSSDTDPEGGEPAEGDQPDQQPETDIADIAPGEHSVTDDGGNDSTRS